MPDFQAFLQMGAIGLLFVIVKGIWEVARWIAVWYPQTIQTVQDWRTDIRASIDTTKSYAMNQQIHSVRSGKILLSATKALRKIAAEKGHDVDHEIDAMEEAMLSHILCDPHEAKSGHTH